jgi:hypothetical protein
MEQITGLYRRNQLSKNIVKFYNLVRQVVLWTPSEISAELWMDASDTSPTNITESGGRVSAVADKSGSANTMTKGTGSQQLYTGDSDINGLNAFRHDDTSGMGLSFTSNIDMYDKEIHYVVQPDLSVDMSILGGPGNYQVASLLTLGKMRNWRNNDAWTPTDLKPSWTLTTNEAIIGASICDITSKSFMLNGEIETGLGVKNISATTLLASNIGWQQYADSLGLFGEIVITSGLLTTDERNKIQGYLAWKWGLVGNLPIGHPYKDAAPTV